MKEGILMTAVFRNRFGQAFFAMVFSVIFGLSGTFGAQAQITPFMQSVAESASGDKDIAAFYRANGYQPIWTGKGNRDRQRRAALLKVLNKAGDHGLPVTSYKIDLLTTNLRRIKSQRDLGRVEVELSRTFLKYARDVQTGVLTPKKVDSGIVRDIPLRDRQKLLEAFSKSSPVAFLRALPPKSPEYARLMKAKVMLERQLGRGGWGATVPARALKPGQSGNAVIALRNRLIAMGYMRRSASSSYGAALQKAVMQFQTDMGLDADGVAGAETMGQINKQVEDRLPNVLVAMERERWMNTPRGKRYVWVNITDFSAKLYDNDTVTFRTRAVVGKNAFDRQTPEFSDVMEYMVINPNWNVPRSIAVKEYLPAMLSNPAAAGHLQLVNNRGKVVSRGAVDFSKYTARTFPFNLRQPPSRGNALGLVKFMFPNPYNIYLHDTPAKSLFSADKRDFSHGCIRLKDPFDFAYTLLAPQESDPVGYFQKILKSGANTTVPLKTPVPVHLVYRTAFTSTKGGMNYRNDVYGRDAKIFRALVDAGVVLRAVQS
jgi:murein L,D-transpeptidase YcbB/YkuD